jgi:hypothetical protein
MATHKVGGEVDAFCTRCKMTLAHTILAMVGQTIARVQCNTCGGQHAYRQAPGAARPRSSSSSSGGSTATKAASREAAVKTVVGFEEQLKGKDLTQARKYSPKDTYAVDEVMDHPTFGFGLVKAVRADKVDVAFKAAERTLVHGRGGGAPAAKPTFSQPQARITGVADKPLPPQEGEGDQPEGEGEVDPDAEGAAGAESEPSA